MEIESLRKLQKLELEILVDLDRFCKKYQIDYSLFAGTALGAVRHSGFIPWDDDIDIIMTRKNFNRFCTSWKENPLDGYFLQNTDSDFQCGINHTKIRKDGTILISEGEIIRNSHHGVWIDIFVLDKVKESKFSILYIYWNCVKRFACTRGFSLSSKEGKIRHLVKLLLSKIPVSIAKRCVKRADQNIQKYSNMKENYILMSLSSPIGLKQRYPKELADEYIAIEFNNEELLIFSNYDIMLKILYGDYMRLPPKEEQICKHNPIRIKFE